jgi:uncharacterized membrane protein
MANLQRNNKVAKNQKGEAILEQHESIDDSLLPSAVELEKLKEIDPSIVPWIMKRAEQEQNARHKWNENQSKVLKFDVKHIHYFNFTAIFLAFILFLAIIGAAVFFIIKGLDVTGTIFGGTAIITCVIFFLRVISKNKNNNH